MIEAFKKGRARGLEVDLSVMNSTKEPLPDAEVAVCLKNHGVTYAFGFWTASLERIFNPIDIAKKAIQALNDPLEINNLEIVITSEIIEKLKKEHGRPK